MDKWNNLSMAERAKYIKLGVQNGTTNLNNIRETYNSYAEGGHINRFDDGGNTAYEPDWSDKIEPYTSALALGADAVGLGTSMTGIGIPIGAAIAGIGNIPNIIVDGWQTFRDLKRQDYKSSASNAFELGLDLATFGPLMKAGKKIASIIPPNTLTKADKTLMKTYMTVPYIGNGILNSRHAMNILPQDNVQNISDKVRDFINSKK